jgi:hypothetical protein
MIAEKESHDIAKDRVPKIAEADLSDEARKAIAAANHSVPVCAPSVLTPRTHPATSEISLRSEPIPGIRPQIQKISADYSESWNFRPQPSTQISPLPLQYSPFIPNLRTPPPRSREAKPFTRPTVAQSPNESDPKPQNSSSGEIIIFVLQKRR